MPNEKGKPAASKRRKKTGLGSYRKRKPAPAPVRAKRNESARVKRAAQNKQPCEMDRRIKWGSNQIDVYTPRSSCSSRSVSESGSGSDSVSGDESEYTKACNINEKELTRPYWNPPTGEELRKEIDQLNLDTNGTWVRRVLERKRKRNGGGTKKRRMTKKHKKSTRITRKRHNKKR